MPPKPWETLTSREVYRNPWIRVREDTAQLPNGRTTLYGVVTIGECVGVLPFVDDDHVVMLRQYRYVVKENERWEMPTGGIHAGETIEDAAQRELMEEIGYRAGRLVAIGSYYTSKSVIDETAHIFLGYDLIAETLPADDTEQLELAILPFDDVLEMVLHSEIRDSMTIVAVLHAARLRLTQRLNASPE